jgi:transcriptional regulator with XRE-family HTH domain
LGGLRIGDNVVWETDAGAYVELFLEKFERHSLDAGHSLIYVSFNRSPTTMSERLSALPNPENITLLDCFTSGKGGDDPTFTKFYESRGQRSSINAIRVNNPMNISEFTEILNDLEEKKGEGTRYVFDSMTGMQALWGGEAKTYGFFTYACPRLYDLNTVAYWVLEKEAHTSSFKANLSHVTQVVLEVSHTSGQLLVKVTKAENRHSPNIFKPHKFQVLDDEIVFHEAAEKETLDLGGKVKALRRKMKLTQHQLAERLDVTASYISQLERNIITPSVDSLLRLMEELRVDPGHLLSPDETVPRRFVQPRNQRQPMPLPDVRDDIVKCQSLVDTTENRRMQPMLVTIEPNSELSSHLFNHKGDEFILILTGEMELIIENETYILREGDSIYLDTSIPDAWRNTSGKPVQAIWVLSPPSV